MRTFSLFPTDDREHRLIHFDGSDTPTSVPETPDTPAPAPETIEPTATFESPEDLNLAADASVEAADADISGMEAPIDEVDQIMNESEGDITADPAVAQTQVDLNAAINGTADFIEGTGKVMQSGAEFIRGFAQQPEGTEAPTTEEPASSFDSPEDWKPEQATEEEAPTTTEEPDYAKMDMADMPGYDSEGNPLPEEATDEEPVAEDEEPTVEEEDETTTEEEEPVAEEEEPTTEEEDETTAEEEEPVAEEEEPTVEEEEESATEEEEPTATEEDETTQEATEEDETTTESKETLAESYEKEKTDQRMSREYEKMSDVASGNPDQWSMIENGKTDGTGKPFLYKEGTNEKGEKVLLAYAPSTGVQVMNVTTGEWKFMNRMSPEEQAKIKGAEGMGEAEHAAALDAAKQQDPDAFAKRMEQNERNFSMEEDCLKNIAADPQWFADHFDDPMWKGNEDVRDALAAALQEPGTTAEKPVTEEPATPAEDSEETEDTEENPEIAELKKIIEEMKQKLQEMSDRLDKLEGGTGETQDEDAEEEDETKDEADEDAETDEDLSAAEIAEKNKKETDEALAELDGEKADEGEAEDEGETTENGESEVEAVKEVEESDETDDEVRARLISEVRNADPMKTVDELTTEKNDAFEKVKEKSDEAIDNAENAERDQDKKVDDLKDQIKDLKQERAGAKKDERGEIDAKISQAESDLATAEATLRTLEGNTETLRKNLETAKDQHDRDITTLETLEAEWTTTADKADKKFDEMGTKLISLGDGEVGSIVQGINVEHDGSLGLKITGNVAPLATFLESILDENDMKKLTVGDNPSIALKGVAALIQGVEQKKEAEATAPTEQTEETPVETPTEAPAEKTEESAEEPTTESDDSAEDAPTEEK